jgi:hypothetical protein
MSADISYSGWYTMQYGFPHVLCNTYLMLDAM